MVPNCGFVTSEKSRPVATPFCCSGRASLGTPLGVVPGESSVFAGGWWQSRTKSLEPGWGLGGSSWRRRCGLPDCGGGSWPSWRWHGSWHRAPLARELAPPLVSVQPARHRVAGGYCWRIGGVCWTAWLYVRPGVVGRIAQAFAAGYLLA